MKSQALIHVETPQAPVARKIVAAMLEGHPFVRSVITGPSPVAGKKSIRITTTNNDKEDAALACQLALQGLVIYTLQREVLR